MAGWESPRYTSFHRDGSSRHPRENQCNVVTVPLPRPLPPGTGSFGIAGEGGVGRVQGGVGYYLNLDSATSCFDHGVR